VVITGLASFQSQDQPTNSSDEEIFLSSDYEQGPNGSVTVRGAVDITDTRGGTALGTLSIGGPLTVRSLNGAIRQAAGAT